MEHQTLRLGPALAVVATMGAAPISVDAIRIHLMYSVRVLTLIIEVTDLTVDARAGALSLANPVLSRVLHHW